ncbi:hypothetical protein E0Z10_g5300 [Xylaria hypoxylon]|uniref:Uncharacterized protein n=1 Tax=Xylaria hypoxylon TaxID=37992 RepID=A0A4Z0YY97_9PEZI|nr:hypothetical protein E0Z10_g5300 [Xylaria hypoxylon]
MVQQHGHILALPGELHLHIVDQFDSIGDISSVVQLNRYFRSFFFDYLFDAKFTRRVQIAQRELERKVQGIPRRTVQDGAQQTSNTANLRNEYIATRRKKLNLMELPWRICEKAGYTMETGYLHFALVADAPRVANCLLKYGVDMDREINDHPELMPLCLALSSKYTSAQKELDAALRIACSYVLPRTVKSLLVRGANPNAYSPYGLNAIHCLLAARLPRLFSDILYRFRWRRLDFIFKNKCWESSIPTILDDLLAYGSDIRSSTQTSLRHECHPECWKSISCVHRGETVVHLATVRKIPEILPLLVDNGADLYALNEDGYTPLYGALRQEHEEAVHMILGRSTAKNPIVHVPRGSTALHIASRFAYTSVVDQLLSARVSANVIDFEGYTPLHEVLKQTKFGREKDVVDTLRSLISHGADPDIPTSVPTPRELAKSHHLPAVRDTFRIAPPERPARLHTRKTVEFADRPAKIQADHTSKSRVWKNPKSLVGVSINSKTKKGIPERTPRGNQVPRVSMAIPIETHPAQEEETYPLTMPLSAWAGGNTVKKLDFLPLSQENKQFKKDVERPRESFPTLIKDHGMSLASGAYDSAAASFWGGLPRSAAGSHLNDKPEQKKPKRGRARWKPFVP